MLRSGLGLGLSYGRAEIRSGLAAMDPSQTEQLICVPSFLVKELRAQEKTLETGRVV